MKLTKFVKSTKHNVVQSYLDDYLYRDLEGLARNIRICLGIQWSTLDPRGGVYRVLFLGNLNLGHGGKDNESLCALWSYSSALSAWRKR